MRKMFFTKTKSWSRKTFRSLHCLENSKQLDSFSSRALPRVKTKNLLGKKSNRNKYIIRLKNIPGFDKPFLWPERHKNTSRLNGTNITHTCRKYLTQ